jgi:hypothetical protein
VTGYELRTRCSARVGIHRCVRRGRFMFSYDDGTAISPIRTWFCSQHAVYGRTLEFYVEPELWPWPKTGDRQTVFRPVQEVTWLRDPWGRDQLLFGR